MAPPLPPQRSCFRRLVPSPVLLPARRAARLQGQGRLTELLCVRSWREEVTYVSLRGTWAEDAGTQRSSRAKASVPKKGLLEATAAGPARPPQPRRAGSRALPRGTRGHFTNGPASPASHAPRVHTPQPPSVPTLLGVRRHPVCPKPAPGSGA